jgi:WS/DGAT/MGAT family acyltransferase
MGKHAMSSADAAWLRMDSPTNLMVVNSVLWFDEPVDWDRLRTALQERVIDVYPRFSQLAVEPSLPRSPHWLDYEDFDLDMHLHHIALPAPGDDGALRELIGDLISSPLDRTKPLWHMYLVEGYGNGSALVCRMHHAIADGIALARVMMVITDATPEMPRHEAVAAEPKPARSRLGTVRSAGSFLVHEGLESVVHPRHVAHIASSVTHELTGDTKALVKLLTAGTDTESVLRGPLVPQNRVAWSDEIPLATIKEIGKEHSATVNDVLVAAVAGAISSYLERHGTSGEAIHAMVPFNLRPLDEPVDPNLGNHFALVLLELPTGEADPAARIMATKKEMDAIKSSREPAVAFGILSLIGLTPPQVEQRLVNIFAAETSLVLTNVPGPREPVYVAGAKVAGVLPWAPCSGSIGMTVTIFSYAGGVRVGFMTDARRVPDPATLARAFEAEVRRYSYSPTNVSA